MEVWASAVVPQEVTKHSKELLGRTEPWVTVARTTTSVSRASVLPRELNNTLNAGF